MRYLKRILVAVSTVPWVLSPELGAREPTPEEEAYWMFGSEKQAEDVVLIASGRLQSIKTAPAVATVITAEDIRNYGFRDVSEALALVPGFHVGLGTELLPLVGVRGFTRLRLGNILFLLDGIAATELGTDDQLAVLGTVPLDSIERIEVTRGPGSTVFGADAFSAVVNVITKKRVWERSVSLSVGSYGTGNARFLLGDRSKLGSWALGVELMRTDGWSPYIPADSATRLDQNFGTASSFAPAYANTDREKFGALLNLSLGRKGGPRTQAMLRFSRWHDFGTGVGLAGFIDPVGTTGFQTLQGRISHDFGLRGDFGLKLVGDLAEFTSRYDDIGWFPPSAIYPAGAVMNATGKQLSAKAQLQGTYDGFQRHSIAAGLGIEHSRYKFGDVDLNYAITDRGAVTALSGSIEPDAVNVRFSRRILYAYLQDEWHLAPKWTLTLGTRVDDYSDVGTQLNSRLALVWTPRYEWTAKLLYGEGFRAPVLLETHRVGVPVYRPNPELDPERLRSLDLHLGYSLSPDFRLGLNVFRHETIDRIRQQDRDRDLFIKSENVGDQVGQGVELEVDWSITQEWSLRGWYAYQYNRDETTDKNAGYFPQHRGFSAVQYHRDRLFLNLQGHFVGDRARIAEDPRPEPDAYFRLNLLGRYDLSRDFSLQLEIRNLLNSNDQEASLGTIVPVDYPLPERNYYATIQLQF